MHGPGILIGLWVSGTAVAGGNDAARAVGAAIADVARTSTPAVVHLEVEKQSALAPELADLVSRYHLVGWPEDRRPGRESSGSGFVVSADGRVLTNFHVVERATEITAIFPDQRRLHAHLVAADPRADLALLQLDGVGPFPALAWGDSDRVRVGELVVAIGSPFDFRSSVTVGIVSARARRGLSRWEIQDYLQTDAAVNPGNSGGPLVDVDGHVVGVNTAIYAPGAEQSAGIAFAIPANQVVRWLAGVDRGEVAGRPWVGLVASGAEGPEVDPTVSGVEVVRVVPGGPAERAGVRRGDVIVSFDDAPIDGVPALRGAVAVAPVGRRVVVRVRRGAETVDLNVEVADIHAANRPLPSIPVGARSWAGMWLAASDERASETLGVPVGRGVVVAQLDVGGAAERLGVQVGDRVVEVGHEPVDSVEALGARLEAHPGGIVVVALERAGERIWTLLPVR